MLTEERCQACTAQTPTVDGEELDRLRAELDPAWEITATGHLHRAVRFGDFASAWAAGTRVALLAEDQGHHPEITVGWGHLDIELWTHAVSGLTRTDLVLAAHIDAALG